MNQVALQHSPVEGPVEKSPVAAVARAARAASRLLANVPGERRDAAIKAAAHVIEERKLEILVANQRDCEDALHSVKAGRMSRAIFERLRMSEHGIAQMARSVREVAALPDPLGRRLAVTELDDGLTLYKESCPIGVVGIVFEARPEIVPQIAALALKSGNAVILKGGAEAAHSNQTLVSIWCDELTHFLEIPSDSINLLYTRADVEEMLSLEDEIDLIIPRGSREFVRHVAQRSRIPVLGHGRDGAIEHINHYGSGHTESIVTEDARAASHFMEQVDAAGVFHNASTRFADGFRYGFGAELGISTSKLHARGPVGLEGLTTYKYKLIGNGQTVASYVSGERSFKHRRVE